MMVIYLMIDETNRVQGWGTTYVSSEGNITVEMDVTQEEYEQIYVFPQVYIYNAGVLIHDYSYALILERFNKEQELIANSEQSITEGFDFEIKGLIYRFVYDYDFQTNLQSAQRLLDRGLVKTTNLNGYLNGTIKRVSFNTELMDDLTLVIEAHKNTQYDKLDSLLAQLEEATTFEEINTIVW